jgi:hypothetical protein
MLAGGVGFSLDVGIYLWDNIMPTILGYIGSMAGMLRVHEDNSSQMF